jgi:hypothetical protein
MQIATVIAVSLLAAAGARADGDPASDVLPAADVFLPYPAPHKDVAAALERLVASANTGGNRLKVAVVATRIDLGAIPSLYGKPTAYARYLGLELRTLYSGVLLIVMRAGFGVYDGGRSTAAQQQALKGLASATDADGLTRAAASAAQRLVAAHVLQYTDVLAPIVVALDEHARRGGTAKLEYAVDDDSGKAAVTVRVVGGTTTRLPLRAVNPSALYSVRWRVPANAPAKVRYCVSARDARGNTSTPVCASIGIARGG